MRDGFRLFKVLLGKWYSQVFPRAGRSATFSFEVLGLVGSPRGMTATVEHKDLDDTSWYAIQSLPIVPSTGVITTDASGLKELVRIAFDVTAASDREGFYLRVPEPGWGPDGEDGCGSGVFRSRR
jgi:hypothetical protein